MAIFHPEALRATRAAAGESPGTALGVFAVGGNIGFALGPALAVPLGAAFGLRAAGAVALVPLAAAVVLSWGARPGRLAAAPAVAASDRHDPRAFLAAAAAATSWRRACSG